MPDDQPYYGSWFLRVDRFADVHMVAAQSKDQSCVLASIKMVAFKVNKLRPGATALQTEKKIEKKYKELEGNPSHDFNNVGGWPTIAAQVLNSLGIGNWASDGPVCNDVADKALKYVGVDQFGLGITGINAITRGYPVIGFCRWNNNGGHAVVIDTITHIPLVGTYATICDPWDANVHFTKIEKGKPLHYKPEKASGFNAWGTTKADKAGIGGVGTFDAIAYCQKSPGFWG